MPFTVSGGPAPSTDGARRERRRGELYAEAETKLERLHEALARLVDAPAAELAPHELHDLQTAEGLIADLRMTLDAARARRARR